MKVLVKEITVKAMTYSECEAVAEIASKIFSGMPTKTLALAWIFCNFAARPRMQYFVAKRGKEIIAYILWVEKGGFRRNSVWELEQIAVKGNFQGKGIGSKLIKDSLEKIKLLLKRRGAKLKLVEVTTGSDNEARKLYEQTLDAKLECVIEDIFRGDEAILIARFDREKE